jgi:ABC-2 type transport system ATP-binding protein
LTAQHLIVIGRGKLLADDSIERIIAGAGSSVRVRSPQAEDLARLLTAQGARIRVDDGALLVTGLDAARIGDIACDHRIALHELAAQHASLEEAFFELTDDSVTYRGIGSPHPPATTVTSR